MTVWYHGWYHVDFPASAQILIYFAICTYFAAMSPFLSDHRTPICQGEEAESSALQVDVPRAKLGQIGWQTVFNSHRIHGIGIFTYIWIHLVDFYGKCK